MVEVKINIQDQITGDIDQIKKEIAELPRAALIEYRRLTPRRTGNAQRKTQLKGQTIQANYAYAEVLDAGRGNRDGQMRGSTQAPQGMTKPWEQWLQNRVDKFMKR